MTVLNICICKGMGWVCENHRDKPWAGLMPEGFPECCNGAGVPCHRCNPCDEDTPPKKTGMVEITTELEDLCKQ
jgi:hypothetical protein